MPQRRPGRRRPMQKLSARSAKTPMSWWCCARKEVKDRDPAAELPPYSLRIDYQPQFFSPDFLSLLRAADIYTGGAHGMVGFEGLIYDLRSRSIVEPQDILAGGAGWEENQKTLTALVLESLKTLKRERLGADYDPERDDSWLQDFALPLDTMTLLASSEPAKIEIGR